MVLVAHVTTVATFFSTLDAADIDTEWSFCCSVMELVVCCAATHEVPMNVVAESVFATSFGSLVVTAVMSPPSRELVTSLPIGSHPRLLLRRRRRRSRRWWL